MKKQRLFVTILVLVLLLPSLSGEALEVKQVLWKGAVCDYIAGEVIVALKSDATKSLFNGLVQNLGGAKLDSTAGSSIYLISFHPDSSILKITDDFINSALVEFAEPNLAYYPAEEEHLDSLWGFENNEQVVNGDTGVSDADADIVEAWGIETGDTSVMISVIDIGIAMASSPPYQLLHPDLNDEGRIVLDTLFTDMEELSS